MHPTTKIPLRHDYLPYVCAPEMAKQIHQQSCLMRFFYLKIVALKKKMQI